MLSAYETTSVSPALERVAAWSSIPWLRAAFSTRQGGASSVYGAAEQNLGWTAEDDPELVARNRQRFLMATAGVGAAALVTASQVHGDHIVSLEQENRELMSPEGRALLSADGLISGTSGRVLGVVTADCVPVLLADREKRVVGAFHAGWRGTLAGIVAKGVHEMRELYGAEEQNLIAAIGPAIGPCCFAVGPEVEASFGERYRYAEELFHRTATTSGAEERLSMDLQEANRRQLLDAGVAPSAIQIVRQCTACSRLADGRRRFFSYRAERGVTGRMLSVIGIVPE